MIFRQTRVGLDGEEFEIFKFRTMIDGAHEMRPELRMATVDRATTMSSSSSKTTLGSHRSADRSGAGRSTSCRSS